MKLRRPYLLRAIHEWICDSDCTPHIVVDAGMSGVDVPRQYVRDGKIVLNVGWNATAQLKIGNDELSFSGRFGGSSMVVRIPVEAVLAIYARETGQGMIFADEEGDPAPTPPGGAPPDGAPSEPPPKPASPRPKLKVVK
ncbi:MAG: ClpXP protease specificity-enhancing factor [Steroidobacteraceae bacterium]|nr:ClpXP protease specificity-enhancing factor [Steroidobacteraceae bacterium]